MAMAFLGYCSDQAGFFSYFVWTYSLGFLYHDVKIITFNAKHLSYYLLLVPVSEHCGHDLSLNIRIFWKYGCMEREPITVIVSCGS